MQGESLGRFGDARLERVGATVVAPVQHNRTCACTAWRRIAAKPASPVNSWPTTR